MRAYLSVFFSGLLILSAIIGWGWAIAKILKSKNRDLGWFAAVGLAFTVIAGGVLNLFSLVSRFSLEIFCLLGLAAFLAYLILNAKTLLGGLADFWLYCKKNKLAAFFIFLLVFLIVLKYASAVSSGSFNTADDYQAYFVFPVKMIQTGHLGADPFSERKVISSLGGQYFLDSFTLAFGQPKNLHLMDMGVCFLAFLLALAGFLKRLKLQAKYSIALLFIAALIPAPIVNITAMYSALVLFMLIVTIFYYPDAQDAGGLIIFALAAAAVCCLKNSLAPACGFFVIGYFLLRHKDRTAVKNKLLRNLAVFLIVTLACMLPWMLASYSSSGTFFYPLLGKGFDGSVYGTFSTATSHINFGNFLTLAYAVQNVLFLLLPLLTVWFICDKNFRKIIHKEDLYLAVAVILAIAVLAIATAGYAVDRYSFAFLLPVILVILAGLLARAENDPSPEGSGQYFFIVLCVGMLAGWGAANFFASEKTILDSLSFGLKNKEIVSAAQIQSYKNLQDSVPAGQTILARMDYNFLFDFKRNTVYIADYPGGASLPPGMPAFKGPQALAGYLLAHSVRYVAYSYKDQANFTKADFQNRLDPSFNAWIRSEAQNTFDFQDNMALLGASRKRIFDDGNNFVLDLAVMAK